MRDTQTSVESRKVLRETGLRCSRTASVRHQLNISPAVDPAAGAGELARLQRFDGYWVRRRSNTYHYVVY